LFVFVLVALVATLQNAQPSSHASTLGISKLVAIIGSVKNPLAAALAAPYCCTYSITLAESLGDPKRSPVGVSHLTAFAATNIGSFVAALEDSFTNSISASLSPSYSATQSFSFAGAKLVSLGSTFILSFCLAYRVAFCHTHS